MPSFSMVVQWLYEGDRAGWGHGPMKELAELQPGQISRMFRPVKSGSFAMKVGLDRDQVACDGWPGGEGGEFSNGDEENGLVVAQLVSLQIQQ